MSRRFQFSLRALLVAVVVAAIASVSLRHWRENRLDALVDRYNDLFLACEYREAEKVAAKAHALYPDELVTQQMMTVFKLIRLRAPHLIDEKGPAQE